MGTHEKIIGWTGLAALLAGLGGCIAASVEQNETDFVDSGDPTAGQSGRNGGGDPSGGGEVQSADTGTNVLDDGGDQPAEDINFRTGFTEPPVGFFTFRTVINFDRYSDGTLIPDNTLITNQFESRGVVFSTRVGRARTVRGNDADRSGWGADWTSEPNSLGVENSTLLVATFVGETPDRVGVVFVDSPPAVPFTIRAFDVDGNVVDERTVSPADGSAQSQGNAEDIFLGVTHNRGIGRVEMSVERFQGGGISGWEIDDFQFGQ